MDLIFLFSRLFVVVFVFFHDFVLIVSSPQQIIRFIWWSQRHNEINDCMDSARRYISIGRQLGECLGRHLQQSILAGDAAEQRLRHTAPHVSSKCYHFNHKLKRMG